MRRRAFLQAATAAVPVALTLGRGSAATEDEGRRASVVDAHLHCFAKAGDARFPYHPKAPYRPAEPAPPETLLRLMDEAGVDFAVVVHPEPYGDDHRYLDHCLEVGGDRLKGTCLFFADRPGSIARLAEYVRARPGRIVAARVHAYAPDRLPPFGRPELRELWKASADLGLAVQLHFEPRYAPGFEPLIREFARTTVIVDHMGRPFQGTPAEHAVVLGWARLPNVVMKIASLPDVGTYPHRDPAPVVRALADAFGPDRLIYGGGFNAGATGDSYRAYRERVRSYLAHLGPDDQAKVLGGTAARLFGFGPARG